MGKKTPFSKISAYVWTGPGGRGLNFNEENLLFSLTGFSTGEMRRLNWRRTFHESIRNACFNLELLSRSFRLVRPGISPLERLWNDFDSDAELFMYRT